MQQELFGNMEHSNPEEGRGVGVYGDIGVTVGEYIQGDSGNLDDLVERLVV